MSIKVRVYKHDIAKEHVYEIKYHQLNDQMKLLQEYTQSLTEIEDSNNQLIHQLLDKIDELESKLQAYRTVLGDHMEGVTS